ncbi:MAG: hypothetical protein ABEJ85_04165 [Haloarculaceae archaeon]
MVDHRSVVGGVGLIVTALAAVAVVSPSTILGTGPLSAVAQWLAAQDLRKLFLLLSIPVGVYLSVAARSGTDDDVLVGDDEPSEFATAVETPPERVTGDEAVRSGAELDEDVAAAIGGGREELGAVRERLRTLAVATLADDAGLDRATAREAVATGDWTDDRTAGAFLADEQGPAHSLGSRIRLWLDPAAERERRVRATVTAIRKRGERP